MTMEDRIDELEELREEARLGGGEERIEKQHEKGKMTARERIEYSTRERSRSSISFAPTRRASSEWKKRRYRATAS